MKNESAYAKHFLPLIKRIKKAHPGQPPQERDPISQLVLGFLQWESTSKAADQAYKKLADVMVDHNDLRVSHPHEVVAAIGPSYPQAEERAHRMLQSLQEIYIREHVVALDSLANKPKKDVRAYLDSLPGMAGYVSAQVTLLCFGGHAVPVDETLVKLLEKHSAVDPDATLEQAHSFIERQIRASESVEAHMALRAWVDAGTRRLTPRSNTQAKATKKTTKASRSGATAKKKKTTKKTTAAKATKKKKKTTKKR